MWWSPKAKDPDGWVYKSVQAWEEETTLTYREQLGVRALLGKKKLGWWRSATRGASIASTSGSTGRS
jgi:hypothetical protein